MVAAGSVAGVVMDRAAGTVNEPDAVLLALSVT